MSEIGKLLTGLGILLAVVGLVIWGLGRAGFRGLPGDIQYQGRNVRVYFPIVTCIVVSVVVTGMVWVWRWWSGK